MIIEKINRYSSNIIVSGGVLVFFFLAKKGSEWKKNPDTFSSQVVCLLSPQSGHLSYRSEKKSLNPLGG